MKMIRMQIIKSGKDVDEMRKKEIKNRVIITIILVMALALTACVGCGNGQGGVASDAGNESVETQGDAAKKEADETQGDTQRNEKSETQTKTERCKHVFTEWNVVEATCSEAGRKTRSCETCKLEESIEIPICGHVADETGTRCRFCQADFPYTFVLQELGDLVETHTDLQMQYLSGNPGAVLDYAQGMEELGEPRPVLFSWNMDGATGGTYTVQLSLEEDFADAVTYSTTECQMDIRNLYIASNYFWRVQWTDDAGNTYCSPLATFSTTDTTPRAMYVEGVSNVRDMGGWVNEDGKRMKQGMMYRSGQLNINTGKAIENTVTENGMDTMINVMRIKTELDLRSGTGKIKESPLPDVNYVHYPMKLEATFITDYSEEICEIFHLLADEKNYPIDMHCVVGTDRTGAMAYLIHGLLGMSEEDLERDYLYSNFANIGGERTMDNVSKGYIAFVNEYEGDSQSERIYNCLLDIGVSAEDLDAVREILLEE